MERERERDGRRGLNQLDAKEKRKKGYFSRILFFSFFLFPSLEVEGGANDHYIKVQRDVDIAAACSRYLSMYVIQPW